MSSINDYISGILERLEKSSRAIDASTTPEEVLERLKITIDSSFVQSRPIYDTEEEALAAGPDKESSEPIVKAIIDFIVKKE